MKKRLTLLALAAIAYWPLRAQLPDGIVAPDFTATDINGNTWTLYELLDQGKSAVLFFGTTWSYWTWDYHQSGRLNQVWEQYGPDGSNEIVPFFIETDDFTTPDDLNGTGGNTYGDFVSGTPYPILDDAYWLGELYQLDDVPRVYHICPNRILTNAIGFPTVQFALAHGDCLLPAGANNAGLLRFVNPPREFCGEASFSPNLRFQNLGSNPLTSLDLALFVNGSLVETRTWTGNIDLYQTAGIVFNPLTINASSSIEVEITATNGQTDDDPVNDGLSFDLVEGPAIGTNFLVVEIKTDYSPQEIYWQVLDENGTVYHEGGNPGIFVGEDWAGAYTNSETVYQHEVALPGDGCYEFVIYDSYGDGVCCNNGLGYYRLQDENNFIYLQGGLFTAIETRPFSLSGAATIHNNAAIRGYDGPSGDFCGNAAIAPSLAVQNIGANTINSLTINVLNGGNLVQEFDWSGILTPGQTENIALDPVNLAATTELRFVLEQANQQPDTFFFQNDIEVGFARRLPQTPGLLLEIGTDEWGYENYWQITNSAGSLIASGGNQSIGPDGGGLQVAQPTDPGSYPQFSTITESISLPDDVNDCYTFLFVDDWADGINEPGFIKLTDQLGNLLFDFRPRFTGETYLIDGQFVASGTGEAVPASDFLLSPNPATDRLELALSANTGPGPLELQVSNAVGQTLHRVQLPAGTQRHSLDLAGWRSGVYFLKLSGAGRAATTKRLVVANP